MGVSKCPCLTFSAVMSCLDVKISLVPSTVPHSAFTLIGPHNTHLNRQSHIVTKPQSHKAKKIHVHMLRPLTYELLFQNSSKITVLMDGISHVPPFSYGMLGLMYLTHSRFVPGGPEGTFLLTANPVP